MHSSTIIKKSLKYIAIALISVFIFWLGYLAKDKKIFPMAQSR